MKAWLPLPLPSPLPPEDSSASYCTRAEVSESRRPIATIVCRIDYQCTTAGLKLTPGKPGSLPTWDRPATHL
jgi:hypothetical protein